MRLLKAFSIASCFLAVFMFLMPSATADMWNKKTKVTFSAPVEIPHAVGEHMLPAGTYVFKLADSDSNRHIVQILSEDEKHVFATVLAIPNERLKSKGKTVMTFGEQPEGTPQTLRTWFYPGDLSGQEFVYRKHRALELATISHEAVPAMTEETETTEAQLETTPIETVEPPAPVVAEAVETPAPVMPETTVAAPVEEPAQLPQTASDVPLVALVGLLSLGLSLGLSLIRKQTA